MSTKAVKISTEELRDFIKKDGNLILDLRPVAAYNGWRLRNESRKGHIRGAMSFPFKWTGYLFELAELLKVKGIQPDKHIVLYAYDHSESEKMAIMLRDAGYADIRVYEDLLSEWIPDPNLPMEHLPRYEMLVYPEWLKKLLEGDRPPEFDGGDFVLCHAHYDHIADYHKGHIPGAIALNTLDLEDEKNWNRRSPEELENNLLKHGINSDTTVILYGRFSYPKNSDPFPGKSAGHLAAIRSAMIMMYAGVKDIRLLNGGITSWETAGYEIDTGTTEPLPAKDFGTEIPARPEIIVDMDEAKQLLSSDEGELVSIRSWKEFTGEVSGYHYIGKKGRIPGAVFGNCGSDAYHMENYRNMDHTTRDYHEIEQIWKEAGITPDKHLAFYCGTGWRGSEAWLNAYLMNWPRVSVYDGGWMEWSSDPANPVATGAP